MIGGGRHLGRTAQMTDGLSKPDGWRRSLLRATVWVALPVSLVGALALAPNPAGAAARERAFDTPEQAVEALVAAARQGGGKALADIFGPGGGALIASGDPVADRRALERFVRDYEAAHRLDAGGGKIVLVVGRDEFPFPIPLVPDGPVWRFDTRAGQDELLARRIGRNELAVIQVCLAIVDAERDYYAHHPDRDGVRQYTQRFVSTPGKRDGLYWDTAPGAPPSPLGPVVARARAVGYEAKGTSGPTPYWGYYYRILLAQGPNAAGGAYDYVAGGRMIGGFAVVAFPARYGASGVMTFITQPRRGRLPEGPRPPDGRAGAADEDVRPGRLLDARDQVTRARSDRRRRSRARFARFPLPRRRKPSRCGARPDHRDTGPQTLRGRGTPGWCYHRLSAVPLER